MKSMNGLQAAVQAAQDAAAWVRTYVPGYPITDLAAALDAEISVNEKVALEIALGASATGLRALVVVKQVGMNILADPLVISATHTIGSGVVVIAGDDLGPRGSQAEMDSRFYGPLAELPVLDPSSPVALHASILESFTLSEWLRIPVIVRVTARLLADEGPEIQARPNKGAAQQFEREGWDLTMRGRHQRHHDRILAFAEEASESTTLNRLEISGNVGIIASGRPAALAEGLGVSLLSVGYSNPLPEKLLRRFMEGHRLILVAEEPEPFIESQLSIEPQSARKAHRPSAPRASGEGGHHPGPGESGRDAARKSRRSTRAWQKGATRAFATTAPSYPFSRRWQKWTCPWPGMRAAPSVPPASPTNRWTWSTAWAHRWA